MSYGARLYECLRAADDLTRQGLPTTVADARFVKPLDTELLKLLATDHEILVTIEEGSIGGFSAHVMQYLTTSGLLDGGLKVRPMILPDRFISHGTSSGMYQDAQLTASNIADVALSALTLRNPEPFVKPA